MTFLTFLARRLFPDRSYLLFYDIGDGLTFGSAGMQKKFFEWLEIYDQVENTNFHQAGPPREFIRLAPLLRRFFLKAADEPEKWKGVTLIVDFPEKLIPASEEAGAVPVFPLVDGGILRPDAQSVPSASTRLSGRS